MTRKEVPRAGLLKAALAGQVSNTEGAQALRLSIRQFQRLKVRFQAEGPPACSIAGAGGPPRGGSLPNAARKWPT